MLVLVSQSLTARKVAGVIFLGFRGGLVIGALLLRLHRLNGGGDLAVMLEKLLEVLWTQNADLGQKQLTLNKRRVRVIEDSPDGNKIIQLAAGLLDNAILTLQHDGHARQVLHLGIANNQTVNVEAAGGQDPRNAGEHTGLVLY
jgi:hypothetical protein